MRDNREGLIKKGGAEATSRKVPFNNVKGFQRRGGENEIKRMPVRK